MDYAKFRNYPNEYVNHGKFVNPSVEYNLYWLYLDNIKTNISKVSKIHFSYFNYAVNNDYFGCYHTNYLGNHTGDGVLIMSLIRIGTGYDVHALVEERPLIVGGVTINHNKGLIGHSDADVLSHAISDALLVLALGNITTFPDNDPKYKIDSIELLKDVYHKVQEEGYELGNLDSVIIAQEPKFKPHIPAIRASIATALETTIDAIGKGHNNRVVDLKEGRKALPFKRQCY